jgi:hypothetical protein
LKIFKDLKVELYDNFGDRLNNYPKDTDFTNFQPASAQNKSAIKKPKKGKSSKAIGNESPSSLKGKK